MSKKNNPTMIGVFVIGAIALIVIGILVFGSGKFFHPTRKYVLFFQGDVANLKPGAPVTFRGVNIGAVTGVMLNFDPQDMMVRIPVFIEIDENQIRIANGEIPKEQRENIMLDLVNRGLRAQLKMQSLLTGQLSVDLDFHPETKPKLVGEKASFDSDEYTEIPTIPSDIERLQRTLKQLPFEAMVAKSVAALEALENLLRSDELKASLASFTQTMKYIEQLSLLLHRRLPEMADSAEKTMAEIQQLMKHTDQKLLTVTAKLETTLEDTGRMADNAGSLMGNLKGEIRPTAENIRQTLASARNTLNRMDETLKAFKGMTTKDDNMGYKLYSTLDELSRAARSIRTFAEYLERNPEALIRGKGDMRYP